MNILRLQTVAQDRIVKNGGVCTLMPKATQTLDASTGNMIVVQQNPNSTFYGVQMSITDSYIDGRTREWSDQYKNSTEIQTAKAKVFLSPGAVNTDGSYDFTITPQIGDQMNVFGTSVYDIIDVSPASPTGIIVGWEVTLT